MLTSTLLLGLVIGMQHAFEADHLAAVTALVSRKRGVKEMSVLGAMWGLGHTVALLAISAVVLFSPWSLPEGFGPIIERFVGLLLIGLGTQLAYRLWRDRVHIHVHSHEDGKRHIHTHSHRDDPAIHDASRHDHSHFAGGWKTLIVGIVHGAAGSAALTVFIAASLESATMGLLYVLVFGLGSMIGMAALTAVVALPLTITARSLTWANRGLQVLIACGSIGIGLRFVMNL